MPTEYIFRHNVFSGFIHFLVKRTGIGRSIYMITYTRRLTVCPIPVAIAAPLIPRAGNIPIPNISIGSSTILVIQPPSIAVIDAVILPTA